MTARDKDRPWLIRTYAGYATPAATNKRFRSNLAKGQTGLSVAFDLPTQTAYDSDHLMSRGEVGKCAGCEVRNRKERLKAVPYARNCIDCQRELEALRPVVDGFVSWPTDVLRPAASLQERLARRIAAEGR